MPLSKKKLAAITAVLLALEQPRDKSTKAMFTPPRKTATSLWALSGRQQMMADRLALQRRQF